MGSLERVIAIAGEAPRASHQTEAEWAEEVVQRKRGSRSEGVWTEGRGRYAVARFNCYCALPQSILRIF